MSEYKEGYKELNKELFIQMQEKLIQIKETMSDVIREAIELEKLKIEGIKKGFGDVFDKKSEDQL